MARTDEGCYRDSLALAHHHGSGGHADRCAPGILALREPVRARGGLVLELGCGSGLLTRHLVAGRPGRRHRHPQGLTFALGQAPASG